MNSSVKNVATILLLSIILFVAVVFGFWAFASRSDYKDNSDKKVAAAVKVAEAKGAADQQAKDAEANKQPYKTYNGSPTYGSVSFNYAKTWSGLVDTSQSDAPINGYFYPDVIPGIATTTPMALRVELVADDYASVISQYESNVSSGDVKASAYIPPKMQGVEHVTSGLRFDGKLDDNKQGSMVIIKVRDKTLKISTESKDFVNDFHTTVPPSLTFLP